jgi:hypothetical protein
MVWEIKLVSTRTEYGGARAVLYWKKSDEGAWGLDTSLSVGAGVSLRKYARNLRFPNYIIFAGFSFLVVLVISFARGRY